MYYVRALAVQKFQVYPGPYDLEIPLDPPLRVGTSDDLAILMPPS